MKELQPINENVLLDITEKSAEVTTAAGIIIPDPSLCGCPDQNR